MLVITALGENPVIYYPSFVIQIFTINILLLLELPTDSDFIIVPTDGQKITCVKG